MAHIRQSQPDYGLAFQVTALKTLQGVPSSLGSGPLGRQCPCRRVKVLLRRGTLLIRNTPSPRKRFKLLGGGPLGRDGNHVNVRL